MNRLSAETSPYLLQHADNPVNWYAWGDEAFARAFEASLAMPTIRGHGGFAAVTGFGGDE